MTVKESKLANSSVYFTPTNKSLHQTPYRSTPLLTPPSSERLADSPSSPDRLLLLAPSTSPLFLTSHIINCSSSSNSRFYTTNISINPTNPSINPRHRSSILPLCLHKTMSMSPRLLRHRHKLISLLVDCRRRSLRSRRSRLSKQI